MLQRELEGVVKVWVENPALLGRWGEAFFKNGRHEKKKRKEGRHVLSMSRRSMSEPPAPPLRSARGPVPNYAQGVLNCRSPGWSPSRLILRFLQLSSLGLPSHGGALGKCVQPPGFRGTRRGTVWVCMDLDMPTRMLTNPFTMCKGTKEGERGKQHLGHQSGARIICKWNSALLTTRDTSCLTVSRRVHCSLNPG